MPNTANVKFNTINNAVVASVPLAGVHYVEGITERGPFSKPDKVIKSWSQFVKIYGGLISTSDFPLLCKRALEGGALLRVNRIGHYTDIDDASTLDATTAANAAGFVDGAANILFTITPKFAGIVYNDLVISISAASNGNAAFFKLSLGLTSDSSANEEYDNLTIEGLPTVALSTYLDDIILASQIVDVTYNDLSALAGQIVPVDVALTYSGGSNGTDPVALDYIGSPIGLNGFHAFDEYDEGYYICAPELSNSIVHQGGAAYTAGRKDLIYFAHLSNTLTTATGLEAARQATNINSEFVEFYAGGIKINHPVSGKVISISELGDILGIASTSHTTYGQWISYAGAKKGKINNSLGVVTNFGSQGKYNDLNLIANRQINMAIVRNNIVQLAGNFTSRLDSSPQSYASIQTMILFIEKTLRPILESYLEEPADIQTFKKISQSVDPFLRSLVSGRALFSYLWDGDQDAASLEDMQINTPTDVSLGKYKINFYIKAINSLQEIKINIILTPAGVSFGS